MLAMDCLAIPFALAQAPSPPANRMDHTTWIALAIGCAATAYVMYRSRRKARKDPLENRTISSSMAQQRAVERQMSNLLIELTEMARTVSASLDTRAAKLEALLDEADQRIETLRAMNGSPASSPASSPAAPHQQALAAEARESTDVVQITPTSPAHPFSRVPETDDRHSEIYVLADQGRSVAEIASTLGRPSGEIELILALRPRATTIAST